MTDEPHPLSLEDTLSRMEPGLSVPDVPQSLASIAISLKRIADHLDNAPPQSIEWAIRESVNNLANTIAAKNSY